MHLRALIRHRERKARTRLAALLLVGLLGLAWLLMPQALVFQHAGQGLAHAGGWLKSAAIKALGGTPRQADDVASVALDRLGALEGVAAADMRCLALAIYFEAGRDGREAQLGIGHAVLNRAQAARTPRALCTTIYQGLGTPQGCQFAGACRNLGNLPASDRRLGEAIEVANGLVGRSVVSTRVWEATHFHPTSERAPGWTRKLQRLATIGGLVFYGPPPPAANTAVSEDGESAPARTAAQVRPASAQRSEPAQVGKASQKMDSGEINRVFGLH